MIVRAAIDADFETLVQIWRDGWHEAHAEITPAEMVRVRTLENFRDRTSKALADMRVLGQAGAPLGFYLLKGDELNQIYVHVQARGRGVAAQLLSNAEARLFDAGVETAWLACAVGNERAARFYEKHGWRRVGTIVIDVETPAGVMSLEVWRYEKRAAE